MKTVTHALIPATPGTRQELVSLHFGTPGAGPKVYIQGGLHAEEVPGLLVAHHLRGLLTAELRRGDTASALDHARRAYRLRPQSEWVQSTLLELQLTQRQWKQAEALLTNSAKRRGTPDATLRRRRAVLLLEQAADIERTGDRAGAAAIAERAHHAAPEFVPAGVAAARPRAHQDTPHARNRCNGNAHAADGAGPMRHRSARHDRHRQSCARGRHA